MWQCPKCSRRFKHNEQSHFCGKIETIDQYIREQNEDVQPRLTAIRETIRSAAPYAKEKISWQMPTFWQNENLIHFAAFKNHVGIYPGDLTDSPFAERIAGLNTSKGTNFQGMFSHCQSLTGIPELDTSQGVNFICMFYCCVTSAVVL